MKLAYDKATEGYDASTEAEDRSRTALALAEAAKVAADAALPATSPAVSAHKWTDALTLSLTGDVTGEAVIDGSEGVVSLLTTIGLAGGLSYGHLHTATDTIVPQHSGFALVLVVGGGGGGASARYGSGNSVSYAGGSGSFRVGIIPLTKNVPVTITIGAGGAGMARHDIWGTVTAGTGGTTTVTSQGVAVSAPGGRGGSTDAAGGAIDRWAYPGTGTGGAVGLPYLHFWGATGTYGYGGAGTSQYYAGNSGSPGCALIIY